MDKNTVYAVVDTEATGTSFHNDDRIIQFALQVRVKHWL